MGFKRKNDEDSELVDEPWFPTLDPHYEPSTQMSSFPAPTQDDEFVKSSRSAPPRFDEDEPSIQIPDSQPPKGKRGMLVKKSADLNAVMEEDEKEKESDGERKSEEVGGGKATAFDVMRKAGKKEKATESFDKTKNAAKEMVGEQAEKSEDEYAGIGGASNDEVVEAHDRDFERIIDDEGKEVVDEDDIQSFSGVSGTKPKMKRMSPSCFRASRQGCSEESGAPISTLTTQMMMAAKHGEGLKGCRWQK